MERKKRKKAEKKPPRVPMTLRMEAELYNKMIERLDHYTGSRNDYICSLIEQDIQLADKFK